MMEFLTELAAEAVFALFMLIFLNQLISFFFDFDPLFEILSYVKYRLRKRNGNDGDDNA